MIAALIVTLTALAVATLVFIVLPTIFYPKALAVIFPVLALAWFFTLVDVTNKVGYAVDSSLIPKNARALVLSTYESTDAVYALLLFDGAEEPRTVIFVQTDENKEALDKMTQQAAKGPTYINFGDNQQPEKGGDGNDSRSGSSGNFTVEGYGATKPS